MAHLPLDVALQHPAQQAEAQPEHRHQAAAQDQVVAVDLAKGVAEIVTMRTAPMTVPSATWWQVVHWVPRYSL